MLVLRAGVGGSSLSKIWPDSQKQVSKPASLSQGKLLLLGY